METKLSSGLNEKAAVKLALLRLQGKNASGFLGLVELCDVIRSKWLEQYIIVSRNAHTRKIVRLEADNGKGVVALDDRNPVWKDVQAALDMHSALANRIGPGWFLFKIVPADYSLICIGKQRGSEGAGIGRELFAEPRILL